jgi:hypothetical protein
MENSQLAKVQEPEAISERDVRAMLAMLDYLVSEISRIDAMSAQCLILARKSLTEAVADSLTKAN